MGTSLPNGKLSLTKQSSSRQPRSQSLFRAANALQRLKAAALHVDLERRTLALDGSSVAIRRRAAAGHRRHSGACRTPLRPWRTALRSTAKVSVMPPECCPPSLRNRVHHGPAQSRTHGRPGTPAEVVLRLLLLKHIRNWSYQVLEREVRANDDVT